MLPSIVYYCHVLKPQCSFRNQKIFLFINDYFWGSCALVLTYTVVGSTKRNRTCIVCAYFNSLFNERRELSVKITVERQLRPNWGKQKQIDSYINYKMSGGQSLLKGEIKHHTRVIGRQRIAIYLWTSEQTTPASYLPCSGETHCHPIMLS